MSRTNNTRFRKDSVDSDLRRSRACAGVVLPNGVGALGGVVSALNLTFVNILKQ
jgi:hypothetical protein